MSDELQEFLKDVHTPEEQSIDEALGFVPKTEGDTTEEVEQPKENRETRRLRKRLEASEKMQIELNERIKQLASDKPTERSFRQDVDAEELDETIARIYGTNTPEGKEATRLLQKAMDERENRAISKALEQFRQEQERTTSQERAELEEAEGELDSFLDEIEDEFGVDLTSGTKEAERLQQAFYAELERISPKRNGVIVEYGDPVAAWENLQNSAKSSQTQRAKNLGSRSMVRSGASTTQKSDDTDTFKLLRENGIL